MSRNRGTFNFAANYEVLTKAPLDARQKVGTLADLILPATWEDGDSNIWLYNGAIVSVGDDPISENNGIYFLKDADNYTVMSNWVNLLGSINNETTLASGTTTNVTVGDITIDESIYIKYSATRGSGNLPQAGSFWVIHDTVSGYTGADVTISNGNVGLTIPSAEISGNDIIIHCTVDASISNDVVFKYSLEKILI